jgi:hypothetical protein
VIARSRFVDAVEAIEDTLAMFGRDAGPAIFNAEQRCVALHHEPNVDRRFVRTVLDRVVDDVGDSLAQDETIGLDDDAAGEIEREPLMPFVGKNGERRRGLLRQLPKIDALARQLDRSGISVREAQQRVDEVRQPVDLFEDAASAVNRRS